MANPGSTSQPAQVQAYISLAAAAHGGETATVTQAPNSSIPPNSFSIHSNSANPVHSETPFHPPNLHFTVGSTTYQYSMETNQSMSNYTWTPSSHPHSMHSNPGDQSMYASLPQQHPVETAPSYDQESVWKLVDDLERDFGADTNNLFSLWDQSDNPLTDPLEAAQFLAANAAAGGETGRAASGLLGGDLNPPAGAVGYELPPGHGSYVHMEGDQSLDHVPICADISTATNGAVPCQLPVGVGHSASSSATRRPDFQNRKSAQGSELPQGPGHDGSYVHMEGHQSLDQARFCTDISTAQNGVVLEAGSVEDDSVGRPRRRRRLPHGVVGHGASSSATRPDCQRRKSAQGFIQPDTVCISNLPRASSRNPGPSTSGIVDRMAKELFLDEYRRLMEKTYEEEAALILDMRVVSGLRERLGISTTDDCKDRFVNPREEPSRRGRYITTFDSRLEGEKPKNGRRSHGHWSEIDAKLIRDPSALINIIGLRRTLEYMDGSTRTCWRANEYVALEALVGDDLRIQEEIAVRTVYKEEDSETTPPSKCPKNCPHCHNSEGSYIWEHMRKVFCER